MTEENKNIQDFFEKKFKYFDELVDSLANSSHKTLSPPFIKYYTNNDDLISFLSDFYKVYISEVKNLGMDLLVWINKTMKVFIYKNSQDKIEKEFNILQEISDICNMILETLQFQFAGRLFDGFECMENVMTKNDFHLTYLLPQLVMNSVLLFRVRNEPNIKVAKDLFHIPFQMRDQCASYRFSLLGYPSLYLAGSVETALHETNINSNNYTCIGYCNKNRPLKFIDLSLPSWKLDFSSKYCLTVFYPLIVACGLKVRNPNSPFKPEYVIPQLFFQYIRLHFSNFDGIAYASTKNDVVDYKSPENKNYALYVRHTEQESGYSQELADILTVSSPISPKINETPKMLESKIRKMKFTDLLL